jgi:rieske iron-sulfur protein
LVGNGGTLEESVSRRMMLLRSMEVALGLAAASFFAAVAGLDPKLRITPANEPPRKGDWLVFAQGHREGQVIRMEDIPEDGPQILAWPMDPRSKTVRKENHLNITLLVRARSESWFAPAQAKNTAGGVTAFSATCTHLCCTVSDWVPQPFGRDPYGYLLCPCHRSHFNPWDEGKVLFGPAARPLPILPISLSGGNLVVAHGFLTVAGCSTG